MLTALLLFVLGVGLAPPFDTPARLNWHDDLDEAVGLARAEGKALFIVFR